jgi:Mg2+/Co2+ transporter CorB
MAVNRYRLRHLVRLHNKAAKRVSRLLERPDRILGAILLGDTLANIVASALITIIAVHFFSDAGVIVCTLIFALFVLIFGQVAPKTVAALYSQRIALMISWPLTILFKLMYPIVWLVNGVSNSFIWICGIRIHKGNVEHLSLDELRTVVYESRGNIPAANQKMLLQILDLEKVAVEDIMIPRSEIFGIDIEDDWDNIIGQLRTSQHTRLPVYEDQLHKIIGILHLRTALNLIAEDSLDKESLLEALEEPYFIPESTPLNTQLLNFCQKKKRIGLVVDEYGEILGLVTLEDLLEEIVGEFTTDLSASTSKNVYSQPDGSYLVDGTTTLRELNRTLGWEFPTTGPKTLSGLIIEYLETIPHANTGLRLYGYPMEILQVKDNIIRTIRVFPSLKT